MTRMCAYRLMPRLTIAVFCFVAVWIAPSAYCQEMSIKEAHATIRSGQDHWANTFKELIEKSTNGRIKVNVFPGGQLGEQTALVQGVQLGTIELAQVAGTFLSVIDPRFDILAAPGIFDDVAHAHRAFHDPEVVKKIWPILESKNIKIIGFACETPAIYNSVEPIRTLDDFKGKKFRVLGSKLETETLARLGATGVPMQLGEALPALQQKAIDGVRAGIVIFVALKFEKISPNVIRTDEAVICVPKLASKRWFDGLPKDLQTKILDAAKEAEELNLAYNLDLLDKQYDAWRKAGGAIYDLSPEQQADFHRRIATVGDDVFKDSPQVKAAYETLKAAAERTRKK
jgi:TRAP-type C4-dicarboxylate transport system substrate-binding protein